MTTNESTILRVPPEWRALAAEGITGTVVIIGASDTGKSSLAHFLFLELAASGVCAAYLDADVGQSTIGLPCTMSVALCRAPGDSAFPPAGASATYFVGSTTPRGHMLPTIIGTFKLMQRAQRWGAHVVIVDTTGLVDAAQGGKALKQWKIELLKPDLVVGLQRHRELEPILWPLRREKRMRCAELPVSPYAATRSREARIRHRRERLGQYFLGAPSHNLSLRKPVVYDLERLSPGSLLAFQDTDGFVLGLGVVEEIDHPGATCLVRTPLLEPGRAASVRVGSLQWDLGSGHER